MSEEGWARGVVNNLVIAYSMQQCYRHLFNNVSVTFVKKRPSLFSVLQEVLHTISAPSGQVQRIVIFKKNGVQAMVEYPFAIQPSSFSMNRDKTRV